MASLARAALEHSIYRAGGMLRFALFALTCVINALRDTRAAHPAALILACAAMGLWSALTWVWNQQPDKRNALWMGLDMAVTLGIVLSGRWILGEATLTESYLGVTVYWMAAAPMAVGIWRGGLSGGVCGVVVGLAQFLQAPSLDHPRALLDFVCMVIVPVFAGMVATELDELMTERDRAGAAAAALAERERLNRIVHDGVLQVLAMVDREGEDLGPKGRKLAALAGEQEAKLRALLQSDRPGEVPDRGLADVVRLISKRQSPLVTVSAMAGEVWMSPGRAVELDAAVGEALANTAKHGGAGARSWVLLEEEDGTLVVSVRDDGAGTTAEEVEGARAAGRLGIAQSIVGRVAALGGTAMWESRPGSGVEWEFRVPVDGKED
jgi:signal transduction histidine kinase